MPMTVDFSTAASARNNLTIPSASKLQVSLTGRTRNAV